LVSETQNVAETLIDLRAILAEREDCDAGTVRQLRNGLAQGSTQFRSLREVSELLRKKLEAAPGPVVKKLHLKLGIAYFFLGYTSQAIEHLRQAESALAAFYLGKALLSKGELDQAQTAFEKAEKLGYTVGMVQLQRAGILIRKGEYAQAQAILTKYADMAKLDAEYHFQMAKLRQAEGNTEAAIASLEEAIKIDKTHTGALFELAYLKDLAGYDEEAISLYEQCLRYPPLSKGVINNLGLLYEDHEQYDKALECFERLRKADPLDERARLFYKDAEAARSSTVDPVQTERLIQQRQILETPISDYDLSVRVRNCLKRMGVKTLGDLTRVTEQELLASKNFGETSLEELRQILHPLGLRIGQSCDRGAAPEIRYRPQAVLSPEEQAVLSRPVGDLNLSVRARKCMSRLNINTLGELVQRTADELLEAKNFGMTSLNEVREKLNMFGLKLKGE
jgi:DNA-directed RNA polymerase subunit alpha